MTLAFDWPREAVEQTHVRIPSAAVRRRRRNGCPERLVLLPTHPPRGAGRRRNIPAGHPKALSWDLLPWEEDDWAWYLVSHHVGMSSDQVAEVMGLSEVRVRQIEATVLEKLRAGIEDSLRDAERHIELTPDFIRGIFTLYDRHRYEEQLKCEARTIVRAAGGREAALAALAQPEQAGST